MSLIGRTVRFISEGLQVPMLTPRARSYKHRLCRLSGPARSQEAKDLPLTYHLKIDLVNGRHPGAGASVPLGEISYSNGSPFHQGSTTITRPAPASMKPSPYLSANMAIARSPVQWQGATFWTPIWRKAVKIRVISPEFALPR